MARDPHETCPFCEHFVDWHDGRFQEPETFRCRCGCLVRLAEGSEHIRQRLVLIEPGQSDDG